MEPLNVKKKLKEEKVTEILVSDFIIETSILHCPRMRE